MSDRYLPINRLIVARRILGYGRTATLALRPQPDLHLSSAVAQVQRMCVSLRPITDNGYFLGLDQAQIGVFVVVNGCHRVMFSLERNLSLRAKRSNLLLALGIASSLRFSQ